MAYSPDHFCPVVGRVITDAECMETAFYAESGKEWEPLPDALKNPDYFAICNACPHHKD